MSIFIVVIILLFKKIVVIILWVCWFAQMDNWPIWTCISSSVLAWCCHSAMRYQWSVMLYCHLFLVYEALNSACMLCSVFSGNEFSLVLLSLGCKWRHGFRSHICSDALWPCTVTCSVVMFSCLFCSFCPKSCPICVLFCSWIFFHDTIYSFCTIIILSLFFFFFFERIVTKIDRTWKKNDEHAKW